MVRVAVIVVGRPAEIAEVILVLVETVKVLLAGVVVEVAVKVVAVVAYLQ